MRCQESIFKSHHGVKKSRPENHRQSADLADGGSRDGLRWALLSGGSGARVGLIGPGFFGTTPLGQERQVGSPRIPAHIYWYWLLKGHGVEKDLGSRASLRRQSAGIDW